MEYEDPKQGDTIFKCTLCNDAEFDTKQKLSVHQISCQKKNPEVKKRRKRIPFGVMKQRFIDVPNDDGFRYRVFNDNWRKEPGRVQRAKDAGYETVDHPQSGKPVGTNEDGTEIIGVLMRIPQEWFDEDQKAKEEQQDELMNQIYQGTYQQQKGDGRYVPKEGIKIETKLTP